MELQDSDGQRYYPYVTTAGALKIQGGGYDRTRTIYFSPSVVTGNDFTLTVLLYGKDKRTYEIMW